MMASGNLEQGGVVCADSEDVQPKLLVLVNLHLVAQLPHHVRHNLQSESRMVISP